VIFRQFVDDDLGCASYLIGDENAGSAVVVDPAFAIEPYVEQAERRRLRIERVLETHTHADHVSGHGRLALEHGAAVAVHPAGEPQFPFEALEDGAEVEVGAVRVRVLHTPGHRPEHCAFVVVDGSRAPEPWLVLTGDSLLVGDVARPDLAVEAREGAEGLFHSLRALTELGDGVEVYPGHVSGSLCGAAMSSKTSSTIGYERRFNRLAALADLAEFVGDATGAGMPKPPNSERIVELNRGPFVAAPPDVGPLERAEGATVLDVRPAREFAAGHAPGAINVPGSGSRFATKAGFVLVPDEPIVLHAGSEAEARRAVRGLQAIGLFAIEGYSLDPPATARLDPIGLDELERLLDEDAVEVLDVREADERSNGYIAGSQHIPYRLLRAVGDGVGSGRPVVTICETGGRAAIAASVLAAAGIEARPVLGEGVSAWRQRGGETVEFRRCGT
jgi:glyoxylase-like metal-dependent hydrolase (beta-lactamase superfamily II)/rhodanese-related sulfurtransferase